VTVAVVVTVLAGLAMPVAVPEFVHADTLNGGPLRESGSGSKGGAVVTVTGAGFGHGVGLSQYGALGMARKGASMRQILTHYYAGTSIASYPDDVDLRVNVVDRGTSVSLRTEALAHGGGAMQLITGGGQAIAVPAGAPSLWRSRAVHSRSRRPRRVAPGLRSRRGVSPSGGRGLGLWPVLPAWSK
jgi:hypothetical protein